MRIIKIVGGVAALIVVGIFGFFTYQFWPRTVTSMLDIDASIPAPQVPSQIKLSAFSTGQNVSPEALIYSGGDLGRYHRSVYSGFVIEHPKATFMLEGGIGTNIAREHADNFNVLEEQLFAFEQSETAKQRFANADYYASKLDYIVLTHLHWDHAAVIPDFPQLPIWTTEQELTDAQATAARQFSIFEEYVMRSDTDWNFVQFDAKQYGPFERSFDVFNDGSVVAVPLGGHTAGSMGLFVSTANSKRYFFIGDASWSFKAITELRPKIPLVQGMVDHDKEQTETTLALLHEVWKDNPDIQIVPTHDGPIVDSITQFPAFE
ncbi:MBL fold metallo-hydrolase [Maritalea sp.]|uniref:MBL fold metallo-hydrolase n=1 Tax=Maritalea sp. TaxID=2003361 RepID=UPI003EF1BD38